MKYIGIDYGTKKIGVAKSDESAVFAFPYKILTSDKEHSHIQEIKDICEKEKITDMVIGLSIDKNGKENKIEQDIKVFIKQIQNFSIKIHRFDERMTTSGVQSMLRFSFQKDVNTKNFSKHAKQVREHTKDDDAKVAAYMLQGFLDKQGGV